MERNVERSDFERATGAHVRELCRRGDWTDRTFGMALGYYQANLAIVPAAYAFEFMLFCQRNPKPCPILDVTDPGDPVPRRAAVSGDVRTDAPRYCVYRNGKLVDEPLSITHLWHDDHVAFLLGCSFSFDATLSDAGIELPHMGGNKGRLSAFVSNIQCEPAGRFKGPMVVNMRPIPKRLVVKVISISERYPLAHGGPVHIGDPSSIGVDLARPDWGVYTPLAPDTEPVFWACGVTPQVVATQSRIPEMITHSAAHMFVTDLRVADPSPLT
ncbi:MAG: putative hydro-lyase [Gammaproteobacteria bacterium]|nr:putative hydro-lyase [Gammaproteobacteria bacterium]